MTEREKFVARFEQKRKDGLVDTKFFVNPEDGFTTEDFFCQANQIDNLVESGDCRRHRTFDENITQKDFSAMLR